METITVKDFKKDNLFKLLTLFQGREVHKVGRIDMTYVTIDSLREEFRVVATDSHVMVVLTFPLTQYLDFILSLKAQRPYIDVKNLDVDNPKDMLIQVNTSQLTDSEPLIIGGPYPQWERVIPTTEDPINHLTKFSFTIHETMKKTYKLLNFKDVKGWSPDFQKNAKMPAITKPYDNVLILTIPLRV